MSSKQPLPPTQHHEYWVSEETSLPETGEAPPFRAPGAPPLLVNDDPLAALPSVGARIGDFDLLRVLGTGSFARVYLARQASLGRLVALKVSRNRGQEARTLAILEHDHVVRVFSESIDPDTNLRLLCMQYVAGTTLERLISQIKKRPLHERNGRLILDLIDETATDPAVLDLAALRDREALAEMDLIEAGCWNGARLAEALAQAHGQRVLHRDVKPANILVNRYGRPLLADFNIASAESNDPREQVFGGTLAYMAPEHLDAFNSDDFTTPDAVDHRSDTWSLGAVLYELFTGEPPYPLPEIDGKANDGLRVLSDQRREKPPPLAQHLPDVPAALERVLARCLHPLPSQRYQNAAELAADLDSCRELRRVKQELPRGYVVTPFATFSPFLAGAVLMLLPQLIATVVNITYNWIQIVEKLTPRQRELFLYWIIPIYDSLAYAILFILFVRPAIPIYRAWKALQRGEPIEAATVDQARRTVLWLPTWGFFLATLGWVVGGIVFPFLLDVQSMPNGALIFRHFLFSFTISGLIAVTYSVLVLQFIGVRVLYPELWLDARKMKELAVQELAHVESRVSLLQFLAVLIPLAGATLMIGVGPESLEVGSYRTFRYLVTVLLSLGMAGLGLALLAGSELRQTVSVLTAGRKR